MQLPLLLFATKTKRSSVSKLLIILTAQFCMFGSVVFSQNVGIGTNSPTSKLQVITGSATTSVVEFQSTDEANNKPVLDVIQAGIGVGNIGAQGMRIILNNEAQGIQVSQAGKGSGIASSSFMGNGIFAATYSSAAAGLYASNFGGGESILGISDGGVGIGAVVGRGDGAGIGVKGITTNNGVGVLGQSGKFNGVGGIAGRFENIYASNGGNVLEVSNIAGGSGRCIAATQNSNFGTCIQALGSGTGGTGIFGEASTGTNAYGIWGKSTSGYAGYFSGNVHVAGTLSKSMGTFKIDHPLDPANKYLVHSFVESPDMLNIYNGNITTDANGEAVVEMPKYFSAANKDFRYQLTVLDESQFVQVRVAKKISGNTFVIKTDKPNIEVSWLVTGVRNDAYAKQHRVVVEVEKENENKGKYLNPLENGQPIEKDITWDKTKAISDDTEKNVVKPSEKELMMLPSERK